MTASEATVLIVDRDTKRARELARQVESAGSMAVVARHLADALVYASTVKPDLAIIALGTWPSTRASLAALRALGPGTEILLTGDFSGDDDTIASVLDDGALYQPTISRLHLEAHLYRRRTERKRRGVNQQRSRSIHDDL